VNGLPGGSVQTWPSPFSTPPIAGAPAYWSQTEQVAHFDTSGVKHDHAVNGVYHDGNGQGKLTFIGGHSFSTTLPYASNSEGPYLRFFYNALFFNGAAVAKMTLEQSVTAIPQGTATPVQLVFKNVGASTATNVGINGGVTITLASGVRFVSMATGPGADRRSRPRRDDDSDVGNPRRYCCGRDGAQHQHQHNDVGRRREPKWPRSRPGTATFSRSRLPKTAAPPSTSIRPRRAIIKTPVTIGPVNVGDIVTWTLSYTNPGSANLLTRSSRTSCRPRLRMSPQRPRRRLPCPSLAARGFAGTLHQLAPGGSGSITLRAAVQTAIGQPFTNNVTLSGTDATGTVFSATSSSLVSVTPPQAQIDKSVSPTGTGVDGADATYTLGPVPGPDLLTDVRSSTRHRRTRRMCTVREPGRRLGAYTPIPATQGRRYGAGSADDDGSDYSTPSPFTQALGSTVTVTDGTGEPGGQHRSITNVTASLTPSDGLSTVRSACRRNPVASILDNNTPVNITFTCTIATYAR
jgi:hypothetical protein